MFFKQLGFIFNPVKCISCRACEMACKNENSCKENVFLKRLVKIDKKEFIPISCNHCQNPECLRVCPENAFIKRMDGIVIIDESRCTGCSLCIDACPFEAITYNVKTAKVSKCQMCESRIDQGLQPACVSACSTHALAVEDLYEIQTDHLSRQYKNYPSTLITNPSIVFKNNVVKEKKHFFI